MGAVGAMTVLAAFLFATSQAAPATRSTGTTENEIIVTGRQEAEVRRFVDAMNDPDRTRQLTRWDREICPVVMGLADRENAYVADGIGEVARSLHLRPRGKGCATTTLVIVTTHSADFAVAIKKLFPITLRQDGQGGLDRFVSSHQPVRWVTITDPCGFGGCSSSGSRLTEPTSPRFKALIVIVDATQIDGVNLGALTDYVSMVVLVAPPPDRRWPATSILSLFDLDPPARAAAKLSVEDRSYLAGLYASRPDGLGQEQRDAIVDHMRGSAAAGR